MKTRIVSSEGQRFQIKKISPEQKGVNLLLSRAKQN